MVMIEDDDKDEKIARGTEVTSGERPPCTQKNALLMRAASGRQSNEFMMSSYNSGVYLYEPVYTEEACTT